MKNIRILLFLWLMLSQTAFAAQVIWVDANGQGHYSDIQSAVDQANPGDQIRVVQGRYTTQSGAIVDWHDKTLSLYGGYQAVNGPRDVERFETVIDGDYDGNGVGENNRSCVSIRNAGAGSEFSGFTVQNGNKTGVNNIQGAGLYVSDSPVRISFCKLVNNKGRLGSGIYIESSVIENPSNPVIYQSKLIGNGIPADENVSTGGGIYSLRSNPVISNTTFESNSAYQGGAFAADQGKINVTNCLFKLNTAQSVGGAIYLRNSDTTIVNSVFDSNSVYLYGGGVTNDGNSKTRIMNSTFFANTTAFDYGNSVWNQSMNGTFSIFNSIFWGTGSGEQISEAGTRVDYSIVKGGFDGAGEGNSDVDPLFVNAANGNFRLAQNSPAIDTGIASVQDGLEIVPAPLADMVATPRPAPQSHGVDQGAYEFKKSVSDPGIGGDKFE